MTNPTDTFDSAAYGGPGCSARTASHRSEIGGVWRACGIDNEWAALRAGEERHVARRLADLGIPILRTLRATATFEGPTPPARSAA